MLKNLISTSTSKDTAIVFLGTLINITAGGLFFILVPRILGPSSYGLFVTVTATGVLAVNIANLGIDTGILRFAKNDNNFNKYLTLALKSYIVLGGLTAAIGFIISSQLANFLNQPQITNLLRIAFASTLLLLLTNFFVTSLQAKKEFIKASLVNISANLIRLFILALASLFFTLGLYTITLLFFLVTIISTIVGLVFLRFKFEGINKDKAIEFYKYNFWIALSLIITSVPFDNYLLLKLSGPIQAGLYAAPFKILTFIHQFSGNFSRVLASRFSSFDTKLKAKNFTYKASLIVAIFSLVLIFITFFSEFVITLILGKTFQESAMLFKILTYGFVLFFAETIPNSIILYFFGKSQVTFIVTLIRTIIFLLLLIVLTPKYHAIGAAYAFLISNLTSFTLLSGFAITKFKGEK